MIPPKIYNVREKVENRYKMIFSNYRSLTGNISLPSERKYFTMCGPCIDDLGRLILNSELEQALRLKFIVPNQFIGVDFDTITFRRNCLFKKANWSNIDFTRINFGQDKRFIPSVINYDTCHGIEKSLPGLIKILNDISRNNVHEVLVIINVISYYARAIKSSFEDSQNKIFSNKDLVLVLQQDKNFSVGITDSYKGCDSKATMATFSFYRR
jgi:hypothetical protein